MPEKDEVQIFYMDDNGTIVEEHLATQIRILEIINGERFETYGVITPNPKQEVDQ